MSFKKIEDLKQRLKATRAGRILTNLTAKSILNSIYTRKNILSGKLKSYNKKNNLFTVNGDLTKVEEVRRLLKFVRISEMITAYDDELFESFVDRIIVNSREEFGFELKCGITLKERMGS